MKKLFLSSLTFCLLISFNVFAQSASIQWKCIEPDSQKVSTVSEKLMGYTETGTAGFVVRDYSKTGGPLGNFQRWWPYENGSAVSWGNETGQVDTRFIQFAVKPQSGNTFAPDSITMYLGAGGTGSIRANVYYSTDTNFTTSTKLNDTVLVLMNNGVDYFSYPVNSEIKDNEILYVRVYPWYEGSPSTSKYVYIQDVNVKGTTHGITYPASALWSLTDPNAGGTGLTASNTGQVTGVDENLHNTEINGYTGYNSSQRIRILGNAWPANQTTQIDTVYIEYALMPNAGFKFNVNTMSLKIGAASINTMKANIYYSADETNWTPVTYSTGDTSANNYVARDTLTTVAASPNVTINPGEKFYIRVYPWVDNDPAIRSGKYLLLQDIMIGGNVEGLPSPSSSTWPLSDPSASGTGLSPVIVGGVKADDEMLVNTQINQYTGLNGSQRIRILGNSWPANQTTQLDTVFVQFSAGPKFGGQFLVDSISLDIAASGINTMKANIYYSADSVTWTPVSYSTGDANNYLSLTDLTHVIAKVSTTINSGKKLYIRVFPWVDSDPAVRTGKYVDLQNVVITGTVSGVTADPPTVTTTAVTNIATTFVTSGGNIPSDGGSPVTARGVCWDTTSSPTIAADKTGDGSGSGSFVSQVTGLKSGTKYYLRAYATNMAGTSYGSEQIFTTLDSTLVPTVSTASVTNIMVKTAQCGGNVTEWGGDTVIVKGIVWNTSGNPTLSDSKTENGSGLGSYTSVLYPLDANTTYYVRAYATNSKGTGYGVVDTFMTQTPQPTIEKIVAQDSSGDYTTVQAAFDGVPDNYTGQYIIYVKNGTYHEKLLLASKKVNVILIGQDRDNTILTYDDYAAIAGGTSGSYSVGIDASDFTAMNITFQNTVKNDQSVSSQQAVALRSNGDRQAFYNCNLLGYQDTYYAWGGSGAARVYMKDCYIEGSVDFIFGRDIVLFDSCQIHVNRNQCSITAASTDADSKFGFVFRDCVISYDTVGFDGNAITKIYLGRAWQSQPRTVFMNTYEPSVIDSLGWNQQPINSGIIPALYGVYQDYGPGYNAVGHAIGIGSLLTSNDAADYTIANIFAKTANPGLGYDWSPEKPMITGVKNDNFAAQIPSTFQLYQNYPNPFNPTTTIRYALPKSSIVTVKIYDILGREVKTLLHEVKPAGQYNLRFDASNLASGIYFYVLRAGDFVQTKKMILLK